jgi:TRAP-type C4-dicarboxylate transport system permease small subunit
VHHWLQRAADLIGGAIFAGLFLVFLIQITARFIFDRPLPWTDEGAVILYIWAILWACAFMVRSREHVVFDLVYQAVGPTAQRLMRIAGSLLLAVLAAIAIPGSWDYVSFMKREGTPVLGIPFMWVFLPFVLLLVSMVLRFGWIAWQAIRGRDGEL